VQTTVDVEALLARANERGDATSLIIDLKLVSAEKIRIFAASLARDALKAVENVDLRAVRCVRAAEAYALGTLSANTYEHTRQIYSHAHIAWTEVQAVVQQKPVEPPHMLWALRDARMAAFILLNDVFAADVCPDVWYAAGCVIPLYATAMARSRLIPEKTARWVAAHHQAIDKVEHDLIALVRSEKESGC